MLRWATLATLPVAGLLAAGCGSGRPPDETIYHDPSLRPGVVEATSDAERELLTRLGTSEAEEAIEVGGQVFAAGAPYAAASGRRCRHVSSMPHPIVFEPGTSLERGSEVPVIGAIPGRLACESDGAWTFVPFVIGATP